MSDQDNFYLISLSILISCLLFVIVFVVFFQSDWQVLKYSESTVEKFWVQTQKQQFGPEPLSLVLNMMKFKQAHLQVIFFASFEDVQLFLTWKCFEEDLIKSTLYLVVIGCCKNTFWTHVRSWYTLSRLNMTVIVSRCGMLIRIARFATAQKNCLIMGMAHLLCYWQQLLLLT